ncbi:phage head-binding domain-containing protein [Serratia ficaria]|uniref:phage head-binding domain-containing protein n=1 Tax=Serratia ficaria TaxID=61651 RepID=UPI00077C7086|nr:phage head-binding domain-containing protein [Serratia ficaria]CAI1025002.1 Head binding [Serratia ficaria]CAI1603728.1 Head binding [Serratia ficaria]CAI1720028.1 Head binding [Serratia ficaria]CAI1989405.1 Head binding [Serratia ficaria]CAI2439845.1 Head binding [Serratia ficaria]
MSTINANVAVSMPSSLFTLASSFAAAANGRIYIGKVNTDPSIAGNQIQVYLENADGSTAPVPQPLNVNAGGYPVYNGQVARFVTLEGHSMAVYDAAGVRQFYYPNVLQYDPAQLRTEVAQFIDDLNGPTGAALVGNKYRGNMQDAMGFITPEMFGAIPNDNNAGAVNTAAINAAIDHARSRSIPRVYGLGIYTIDAPILIDDCGQGFELKLSGLKISANWPKLTDWKKSLGAITISERSHGSQVGIRVTVGYFHGLDKRATLFRLKGTGCGSSYFEVGNAESFCGLYENTETNLHNSPDNTIRITYANSGYFGVRIRRANNLYIAEGHKLYGGFIKSCLYGAIQLFNGAQYFTSQGIGTDFNGRCLCEYTVDTAFTPSVVREQSFSNGVNSRELLDYYIYSGNTARIICIEPLDASDIANPIGFSVGDTITMGEYSATVTAVRRPATDNFYPDVIHGFTGSPFGKCDIQLSYCGGIVGGLFNTSTLRWYNSSTAYTTIINGLRIRSKGTSVVLEDVYLGSLLEATQDRVILTKDLDVGSSRLRVDSSKVTLNNAVVANVRTFAYKNDEEGAGDTRNVRNLYRVTIKSPSDSVRGQALVYVSTTGIEVVDSTMTPVTLSATGFTLRAVQSSQPSLFAVLQFERI